MPKTRRRINLIQPGLQLRLVLSSLGICVLGLLFECLLFSACLAEIAVDLPQDGPIVLASVRPVLLKVILMSCAGILPMVFVVGVLTTFRIAGPVHRLEVFLKQIARGENPPDCRLRRGDELSAFCDLLNTVTAPLRRTGTDVEVKAPESRPSLYEAA